MPDIYIVPVPVAAELAPRIKARLLLERADGHLLTEEDCRNIEATYAAELAAAGKAPTRQPKPSTRAKTKTASKPAARSAAKELRAPAKRKAG